MNRHIVDITRFLVDFLVGSSAAPSAIGQYILIMRICQYPAYGLFTTKNTKTTKARDGGHRGREPSRVALQRCPILRAGKDTIP